ncbi:STAS domain-containing protein [Kitasatospora sp. NPDC004240]
MRRRTRREETPAEAGGLVVESRVWAEGVLLTLRGELDIDTVPALREAVDVALGTPGTVLVIDCGELEFCDSTGLNLLLRARSRALEHGSRIELARPRAMVLRMLELTGASDAFHVHDAAPPVA